MHLHQAVLVFIGCAYRADFDAGSVIAVIALYAQIPAARFRRLGVRRGSTLFEVYRRRMPGNTALSLQFEQLYPERGYRVRRVVLFLASVHTSAAADTGARIYHH
jgi:hypothetical protein